MHSLITFIAKDFIALPVLAAIYFLVKLSKKNRVKFAALLVVTAILTIILVKIGTTLIHDPRPFVKDGVVPYFKSSMDNGFPSDHTALSAVIAFAVLHFSRKWGLGLLLLAIIIGTSRVIAGVHHAEDIIGALVIAAVSYAIARLVLVKLPQD